ncbi:conserved hypothetical protein [Desulforapulum autotrophicum HRM2]|uniref:Site-2 protease family protein n=1 Tax=Desulforapulum autotrophicum (strain ATCC 43914 / DSM 3382 / VKM B-1955 / HRM2) TaxID=177437 RepID=C0QJF0_DESAH|nr:hypothetical protein [Desulforapulum autotrophicum]ACN15963.1 conserved hypothetical protein [Desulforapulum autotrophicum HRM2]
MEYANLTHLPFILDFSNLQFDTTIIFIVSILLAITVNAEAQAFMATLLGDAQTQAKDRFHFNPLGHMNLSGVLCFAVAGFGWPKQPKIHTKNFKHPDFYLILVKFAGPFANLMLASIAGSILWIMGNWGVEDQVFPILVAVNIIMFVTGFIPIPPLAGASLVSFFFPKQTNISSRSKLIFDAVPYLFVAALVWIKLTHGNLLDIYFSPVFTAMFNFISG